MSTVMLCLTIWTALMLTLNLVLWLLMRKGRD